MPQSSSALVGHWEKITQSACSQAYPLRLHFQVNGLYFGQTEPSGGYTVWDAGTYEVVGPDEVQLSTANDAIIGYRFSLGPEQLTFVDGAGCRFDYRRVG
jgi:hypothetical protein